MPIPAAPHWYVMNHWHPLHYLHWPRVARMIPHARRQPCYPEQKVLCAPHCGVRVRRPGATPPDALNTTVAHKAVGIHMLDATPCNVGISRRYPANNAYMTTLSIETEKMQRAMAGKPLTVTRLNAVATLLGPRSNAVSEADMARDGLQSLQATPRLHQLMN